MFRIFNKKLTKGTSNLKFRIAWCIGVYRGDMVYPWRVLGGRGMKGRGVWGYKGYVIYYTIQPILIIPTRHSQRLQEGRPQDRRCSFARLESVRVACDIFWGSIVYECMSV